MTLSRTHRTLLLLVTVPLVATPVGAAEQDGWFLFGNAALLQPYNASLNGATVEDVIVTVSTFEQSSEILRSEPDSKFAGRFGFGFDWGEKGRLSASYWTYDTDGSQSTSLFSDSAAGMFRQVDDSMGGAFFGPQTGTVKTQAEIEATSLDVDYWRMGEFDNPGWVFGWMVGARAIEYDETMLLAGSGNDVGGGNFQTLDETYSLAVDAVGFKIGGRADYRFAERFSIYGAAVSSFVVGDSEERIDSRSASPTNSSRRDLFDSREASGTVWDFLAGVGVFRGKHVQVSVEYQISSWHDLVSREVIGQDDIDNPRAPLRSNVSFAGLALNVLVAL